MTDLNKVIDALLAKDATRDSIIIELVSKHELSLDKATKTYGAYARENGLTKTVISYKSEALDYLKSEYPKKKWDAKAVRDAILEIQDQYKVAESTARDYCKAYSETLGVALPMVDPREAIFDWFADNVGAAKDEFIAFAVGELGRSRSNANEYWKGYELHCELVARSKE